MSSSLWLASRFDLPFTNAVQSALYSKVKHLCSACIDYGWHFASLGIRHAQEITSVFILYPLLAFSEELQSSVRQRSTLTDGVVVLVERSVVGPLVGPLVGGVDAKF